MIYEFKSRATGNLVMTQSVGERVLGIIGKTPGPTGIITVQQMPGAIEALRKAAALDKGQADRAGDEDDEGNESVGLSQRVFPFIEMIEQALAAGKDITWGV